ncbi:touch receptor neuron protein Mec-17-domain-containing protein [Dunaliella salina]|uniref:Alpha-tubulin N-acetyltransferase n=1 Tax=Dunaliella salina TaxID=3046 RepID=A0ABQ7GF37_DUNSA|nr:touch receptor neuron protein Mec-17-domain-containing protein [Dunaliella salina]|eukprot:KAF5833213.1 touch receptor neuron protein Mec-17-domain-containing protein [Dunaliella salina]
MPWELDFVIPGVGGAQPITLCNGDFLRRLSGGDLENLKCLLDSFGKKSAAAQGLGAVVTDIHRLKNTDQRLYLYASRQGSHTLVHGGLKIGTKKLFVIADDNSLQEINPTCVLDFYVHEACQRKGIGKELFEHFLAVENQHPGNLAYDRPSPKLLAFLSKHYGLRGYIPQNNNFVVYNVYWSLNPHKKSSRHGRDGLTYGTYPYQRQQPSLSKTAPPPRADFAPPLADCSNHNRPVAPPFSQQSTLGPQDAPLPTQAVYASHTPGPAAYSGAAAPGASSTHPPHMYPATRTDIHVPSPSHSPPPPYGVHLVAAYPQLEPQVAAAAPSSPTAHLGQPLWASNPHMASQGDSLDQFRAGVMGEGGTNGSMGHGHPRPAGLHIHTNLPPYPGGPTHHLAFSHPTGSVSPSSPGHLTIPGGSASGGLGPTGPGSSDTLISPNAPTYPGPSPLQPRFVSRPPWGEHEPHVWPPAGPGITQKPWGSAPVGGSVSHPAAQAHSSSSTQAHALQPQAHLNQTEVSSPGAAASNISKATARAQRSGGGAASCLVW